MTDFDNGGSVSVERAHQLFTEGALLLDVRRGVTRETAGVVPGAVAVDKPDVETRLATGSQLHTQAQGRAVVVYCTSEGGSRPVVAQLVGLGYPAVVEVSGGFPAWKAAGYPVTAADATRDAPL